MDGCPVCGAALVEDYIDYKRVIVCEECGGTMDEWSYITPTF